jgi:hypothetical protein|tara:strand:+ start:453 stop:665 length:213 start_codon:yes stop_codon:yes gene_type:complete
MLSFLKSIKHPFNNKVVQCLSILAIVLVILYFTGFINKEKLPFENYEDAPAEKKTAIDKVKDAAKALFGM